MGRKFLTYGFLAIGGYLVLVHFTGARTVLNSAGTNSVNVVKAFQGRGKR